METLEFAQGRAAERRRVAAILLAPQAKGRERIAIEIALNTPISVEGALEMLALAPPTSPVETDHKG